MFLQPYWNIGLQEFFCAGPVRGACRPKRAEFSLKCTNRYFCIDMAISIYLYRYPNIDLCNMTNFQSIFSYGYFLCNMTKTFLKFMLDF